MLDDFDLMIQPEELIDEDEISLVNLVMEDEDEDEETEYFIEITELEDLEELFATQLLNIIGDDFEDLTEEELETLPDDIIWEYEINDVYELDDEDIANVSRDFFDMLNED